MNHVIIAFPEIGRIQLPTICRPKSSAGAIVGACTGPAMAVFLCPLLAVMGGALGDLLVASKAPAYALATWLGDLGMWNSKK